MLAIRVLETIAVTYKKKKCARSQNVISVTSSPATKEGNALFKIWVKNSQIERSSQSFEKKSSRIHRNGILKLSATGLWAKLWNIKTKICEYKYVEIQWS